MKGFRLMLTVLCLAILSAGPAWSEVREFADFSIDVPDGWSVERDGITTAFIAEDKSALLQVTVELITSIFSEGMDARGLAEAYADELKGSRPKRQDNDPNFYSFTFTSPDGSPSEASIVVTGGRFYLITISGKHRDLAGMVESVLLSIL